MTEARLIKPISYRPYQVHISAIRCIWSSRMSRLSWNQVPFVSVVSYSSVFLQFFWVINDILRKMDFSSVWQAGQSSTNTSSAFKVKFENLRFLNFLKPFLLKKVEKNVRVGHILKLWEIFLTEWSSFVLWIIDWTIFSIWSPLIVHSSVPCTTLL